MAKLFLKLVHVGLMIGLMIVSSQAMQSLETKKEYLVVLFPGANNEMSKLREVAPMLAQRSGKDVECFDVMETTYPENHWFPQYTNVNWGTIFPKVPFEDYPKYLEKLVIQQLNIEERLKQRDLSSDKLILVGFSEGGTAALHMGLSVMNQPVGAIISFCSIWQPQPITNGVKSIYLTNGQEDAVISHNVANRYMKQLKEQLNRNVTAIKHKKFRKDSGHYVSDSQISIASKVTLKNLGIFKI